jgi:hypothetical protein
MTTKGKVPGSKLYGLKQAAGEVKESHFSGFGFVSHILQHRSLIKVGRRTAEQRRLEAELDLLDRGGSKPSGWGQRRELRKEKIRAGITYRRGHDGPGRVQGSRHGDNAMEKKLRAGTMDGFYETREDEDSQASREEKRRSENEDEERERGKIVGF